MRKGLVLYNNILAGELTETDEGDYEFEYYADYVAKYPDGLITFSLPVRKEKYVTNRLFPFFEGLIPEGWLLDIVTKIWKLNVNYCVGLVLACCRNCIGADFILKTILLQ
ncbi:HipA N-terminal domain-containing protein [Pedobacter sp. MC2016-15]|uniref:HipA N-terminal domain-containing protein n=1 Tax=Pedobacter sp. MC2016-15 TaxID=2994473 RepID=UPI0022484BAA|nr:HipA N-terminal domain-containing protein [Pedobacter sp. MC2016-15]MCX2481838.1 HipA N-terminal domain-containing protein [Pedobacter sp. MC2016-15]